MKDRRYMMDPLLTAAAMREADRATIEDLGLPGFTLMETAGRAAVAAMIGRYGPMQGKTAVCLCGKGNNGGDGFVVARALLAHGARVKVLHLGAADDMTPDAAHNLRVLRNLAPHVGKRLSIAPLDAATDMDVLPPADVYVDALLGTGLTSDLRDPLPAFVEYLNAASAPTVALDMPTGLHSDTGAVLGTAIRADLTVTMAVAKVGLFVGEGPAHAGHVEVAEIGIPDSLIRQACTTMPGCAWRPTDASIAAMLPGRTHTAHKYSVGLALVVAGAPGLTGAPVMASHAAARAGAGAVVCACPASVQPVLAQKFTEVMTLGLPEGDEGLDVEAAYAHLTPRLEQARALLVGCGLGRATSTQQFVRHLLHRTGHPVVVDADGLHAVAGHLDALVPHLAGRWVLTPHLGEFRRLVGDDVDTSDRVALVRTWAERWQAVLILKGLPSLVGCPDGSVYVNATGNPALATAGTGDILAGLTVGFLAQGLSPRDAALAALHLGGQAADRFVAAPSSAAMLATDLLTHLTLPHSAHP